MKLQKVVFDETRHIAIGTGAMTLVMLGVFALLGRMDSTVLLGAVVGFVVAVGNFFLMARNIQKVTEQMDPQDGESVKRAQLKMRGNYTTRLLGMAAILAAAIKLLNVQWIAAFLPLFFPRVTIMCMNFVKNLKAKGSEY